MRGIALGVVAGAAALFAAAPASARTTELSGALNATGGVTITWHGDPARGCDQAGLCGYSGSIALHPDDGQYDFTMAGGRLRDSYSFLDVYSSNPIVRVKRNEGGNEPGACVDVLDSSSIDLTTARAGRNRVRLGLDEEGLSPGRCAGPDLSGLLTKLARRTRSLSGITAGRARAADFSGQVPFSRGRFSGTIRSTLRVGFGKGDPNTVTRTGGRPPPDRRPLIRVVDVHVVYRVASFAGALTTSFGALTDPPCADLDACGVSGSSRWTVNSGSGAVAIDAVARARRADHGVHGALAAVRRGPASVFGEGDLSRNLGAITANVNRAGGATCQDTASAGSPGVAVLNEPAQRLTFELGGEDAFPSIVDIVRTGCPGPRDEDVLGRGAPAVGSVSLAAFGQGSIAARMRGSGQFSANGYSGTRSADLTLELKRVSIRAAYRRARGIE